MSALLLRGQTQSATNKPKCHQTIKKKSIQITAVGRNGLCCYAYIPCIFVKKKSNSYTEVLWKQNKPETHTLSQPLYQNIWHFWGGMLASSANFIQFLISEPWMFRFILSLSFSNDPVCLNLDCMNSFTFQTVKSLKLCKNMFLTFHVDICFSQYHILMNLLHGRCLKICWDNTKK
jgi:hypothetical protein